MKKYIPYKNFNLAVIRTLHSNVWFFSTLIPCFKKQVVIFCLLFQSQQLLADYIIADGTTVNASTIMAQTGVLTINGTLNVNTNVYLSGITSVIINAPNGNIYWPSNYDLKFQSNTTVIINGTAPGLQPTSGNASKRLIIGTIVVAVSNDNSNNASFSFAEFNTLGGMPQFAITSNSPTCAGTSMNLTATPSLTSNFVFQYSWTAVPYAVFSPFTASSTGATSTTINPTAGTYNVTLNVRDINGDLINRKVVTVVVNPLATISRTSSLATISQNPCYNTNITPITYTVGGAGTGASVTGLPLGVTGSYNAGIFTIQGAPTEIGTFNYTVTTTGGSCPAESSGTITVGQVQNLSGASVTQSTCESYSAQINLTGLLANSTNNTIFYSINGVAQTSVTGITSDNAGNATFSTIPLTYANNGQTLSITQISNAGCSVNFSQDVNLSVNQTGSWLGNSTDWFDINNWCGGVPTTGSDAILPNGVTYYPELNSGTASVNDIIIGSSANIKIDGGKIRISGLITNNGIFNCENGIIELNGSGVAQSISGSWFVNRNIYGLVVSNPAGVNISSISNDTLNILDFLKFGNVNNCILNTGDNIALKSKSNNTARVEDITNNGTNSNNSIEGKMIIERFLPMQNSSISRRWRLLTTPIQLSDAPTLKESWQEGVNNTIVATPINPRPGYGTLITNGNTTAAVMNGFDMGTTASPSIYYMSPGINPTWGVPSNTHSTSIASQEGYMIFVRGDRSIVINNQYVAARPTTLAVKGKINYGPITKSLVTGKQVIGNPYPSSISFDNVLINGTTPNANGHTFYTWDPKTSGSYNVGKFVTVSNDGVGAPSSYTVSPLNNLSGISNGTIESGTAVVIISNGQAPNTIVFNESDKINLNSTVGIASRPSENAGAESLYKLYTNLFSIGNDGTLNVSDGVASTFHPTYSNSVDEKDALKLASFNTKENLSILRDNIALAIEKRTSILNKDTVHLEVRNMDNRKYKFQFIAKNFGIYTDAFLEDSYTGLLSPIQLNGIDTTEYNFTINNSIPASANPTRFKILFQPSVVSGPLPVSFTAVNAFNKNREVMIEWKMATEINSKEFIVEKSTDGINFSYLSTVKANGLNSFYQSIDEQPFQGANYYRIKYISFSEEVLYSKVVKVIVGTIGAEISVYPSSLIGGTTNLNFQNTPKGIYLIRAINAAGQILTKKQINHIGGSASYSILVSNATAAGIYTIEVMQPDKSIVSLKVLNQ